MQALPLRSQLAPTPVSSPLFRVEVPNYAGVTDTLADPRATRTLIILMNQCVANAGAASHWGGSSAFVEIMASLHAIMFRPHKDPWHEHYNFVNDAGHCENGIYALRALYNFGALSLDDLKGFRSLESRLTGHGEAYLYPEGVMVSNGPLGSAIGQAQGLCLADRVLGNSRITVCTISDGACMEGEAKECFAAIGGLAQKGRLNPFLLLISDNNTKLSGRISEDSFSMEGTFRSFESLGWEVFREEKGNNLGQVHLTIDRVISKFKRGTSKPTVIIFKTTKGRGVAATELAANGGHGYPLKAHDKKLRAFVGEIWKEETVPEVFLKWMGDLSREEESFSPGPPREKVQVGLSRALIRAGREGLPVFSLSADLQGSTGVAPFHREFPHRFLDLGVAESNMISTGVGLSKQGLIPIVDTFAQFAVTKGNLPLLMSALSEAPVIGLFSHAGLQDAADGASHQATSFIAATASMAKTVVVVCSCSREAEAYLYEAVKMCARRQSPPESVLFFYGRENHPSFYREGLSFEWRRPQILAEGGDGVIVACGPLVDKALRACEMLKEEGVGVTVVNHPFVNRIDVDFFGKLLKENKNKLITVEDHQRVGGMGSLLAASLLENGLRPHCRILGIQGELGRSAYKADHLYCKHNLDEESLCKAFRSLQ